MCRDTNFCFVPFCSDSSQSQFLRHGGNIFFRDQHGEIASVEVRGHGPRNPRGNCTSDRELVVHTKSWVAAICVSRGTLPQVRGTNEKNKERK